MLVPTVFSGQQTRGLTIGHYCLITINSVPRTLQAGGGTMPNKFLITQCSIRQAGLNSSLLLAQVMHYGVTCPYGLNICSVIDETITDIFHPYVRALSPSHRVGLMSWFPLPRRQGSECREKKRIRLGGWHFFWAYRYQLMQGVSLKLPTTGWHLTSHRNSFRTDCSGSRNRPGSDLEWQIDSTCN